MSFPIKSPRKLIEVALPLDAINLASAKEKSIRHGHPSTLHLWWSRKPTAAARAVIFAQLVNDPGYQQGGGFKYGMNKKDAADERKRLFRIIEELVLWENSTNESVLERARAEIRRSWREVCELNKDHPKAAELFIPDAPPAIYDPFAGGGSIPLEAQRLGLDAYASDLNPVAVLINKAMIELPPKFAGRPPVSLGNEAKGRLTKDLGLERSWPGARGLAEDVRHYGAWMRAEAEKRIGHLYPPITVTVEMTRERPDLKPLVGRKLTVIAWLWARTVVSPNPAFAHAHVPVAASFVLSTKVSAMAYVEPVIEDGTYRFVVRMGAPTPEAISGTQLARGSFGCIFSKAPISYSYIDKEANAGRMNSRLMAIVCDAPNGRVYLDPDAISEEVAISAKPSWKPDAPCRGTFASNAQGRYYGFKVFGDYFTARQLVALNTYCDLLDEVSQRVISDAHLSGQGEAPAYADAIRVYLALAVSRLTDICNALCRWEPSKTQVRNLYGRQGIAMMWGFAENNVFAEAAGDFAVSLKNLIKALDGMPAAGIGFAYQADAQTQQIGSSKVISSDPPYYDNVGYADLSDFFYVWLRRALQSTYPDLFTTILVPKVEELVATPYRHGGKEKAEEFFLDGMTQTLSNLAQQSHPERPLTIYYAFKQSETEDGHTTSSTGWETFLDALSKAGLQLTGTWPLRTELVNRMSGMDANSLASSIVLVCRKRSAEAPTISRREFIRELNIVLPEALDEMTKGAGGEYSPVAPVDLSQAIIGPGMAVFSKYAAVLEANGNAMTVRAALQLINRFLAEDDFDADTQWCLRWFEQHGWAEGVFGEADVLARSKSISVSGLAEAGVVVSGGGKVALRKWADYPTDWDPHTDIRQPVWETLHHLIRALKQEGESGAGKLLAAVKAKSEATRQLAYRLYTLCERQGWAEDARAYNELITSWTGIESAAGQAPAGQTELFN